jgi:histidyl-tRNA synthetase
MADTTIPPKLVTPETLKGFRDYLPEDAIARERVVGKIKAVYEKYGFVPLDTPILENLATLVGTGGEEANKQLFRLSSPEGMPIAMRYDLTVPFARLIAQYPQQLVLPFRRYHIGPVFRADDPGPGRFRQFTQFDIDAAGSESVAVDAEIVATMCEVMREIGLRNPATAGAALEYQVSINNRKLVDALLGGCGITDDATVKHVLRVVDKLHKVGLENVRLELAEGRVDDSGDPIRGVGLTAATIDTIIAFITCGQPLRRDTISAVTRHMPNSEAAKAALREMEEIATALEALGVPEQDAVFDPSLARGLAYYTGPVFEAILPGVKIGSVMGGGRYDGLVRRFLNEDIPATGVSIGLDRLLAGLKLAGKLETGATTVKALVVSFPGVPVAERLRVVTELRAAGIAATVYFGEGSVSQQTKYANDTGIPVAVMLGEDELKAGTISVKNLTVGKQRSEIKDREEYRKASRAGQDTKSRAELVAMVQRFLDLQPSSP